MSENDANITRCVDSETLVAYLRGELEPSERERIAKHLDACEACRAEARAFEAAVARLESDADVAPSRDVAADVLAKLDARDDLVRVHARVSWRMRVALATAAALLVAAGAWVLVQSLRHEAAPRDDRVTAALTWLRESQEPDGSWDPAKWGGEANYRTGVTGLALMALTSGNARPSADESLAAKRATDYLLAQQSRPGSFGPFFSQMLYNHGIATVALLERYRETRDASLAGPIGRAVAFIRSEQQPGGGWGYVSSAANTSITAWQLEALLIASGSGWADAKPAAEKGLAWVETTLDKEGRAGYSRAGDYPYGFGGLTAMAAMCLRLGGRDVCRMSAGLEDAATSGLSESDYVQVYFLDRALLVAASTCPGEEQLAHAAVQLRRVVAGRQLRSGPNSGSWDPSDRWGKAGGRVYATAMGALSLEAGRSAQGQAD